MPIYLVHQTVQLGAHSNTPPSNGNSKHKTGLSRRWRYHMLREEAAQMLMAPSPATLPSLHQSAFMDGHTRRPYRGWERDRRLRLGSQIVLHDVQKWVQTLLVGRMLSSTPSRSLHLEGQEARHVILYSLMGCGQQVGWSGTWKEYEWKVGDKEIYLTKVSGEKLCWRTCLGKTVKVLMSCVSAHCRMTWAERGFNSQMGGLVCQPLSREPCHQPAGSWARQPRRQSWSCGTDSAAGFPLTKTHLASGHCVETNTEYLMRHQLPGWSASFWGQVDYTGLLSS